ncbi:MAG: hypothetical protein ACN4G0_13435 [Polyangiales bacterium]
MARRSTRLELVPAGAQLLYRSFPGAGRLAIVPQGPLVTLAKKYRLSRIRVVN